MPTPRQRRVVRRHAALTLVALPVFAVAGVLTPDTAVVAALLSLLVAVVVDAPVHVRPTWRARLRWVLLLGVVLFLGLAARHSYAVLRALSDALVYT
ncbi:hypothetical protein GCM10009037_21710 [Halarchaeum grantii]|uniref:Uncharacterized protein n=1 Tax=Halarchaeum grantii TaxID=1193105 RepID=A0A830FBD5_9EURY|nr:hypothetical protein [Halarchaeum grantii]GGL37791.1 hypothetical protein GCM10009037_21710 [Halarchaeum grantii]